MSIDDPIWSECDIPLTDIAPHDYDLSLASSLDGAFCLLFVSSFVL